MNSDLSPPAITAEVLDHLKSWEGRCIEETDVVTVAPLKGLAAILDVEFDLEGEQELPPLWHWLYFLPNASQSSLGLDGHPRTGNFLPPIPLERRMWAGGRLSWVAPLRPGDLIKRVSRIESVKHKQGRTGDLCFVLIRYEVSNQSGIALIEEQDIVYRGLAKSEKTGPSTLLAPENFDWSREMVPDPVLLFRYSALTFNAHRIHYDADYAKAVEGYSGLVVQGPLIATLLAELSRRELPGRTVRSFDFKAIRPLIAGHPFQVCAAPKSDNNSASLWARDHAGFVTMQANISFG